MPKLTGKEAVLAWAQRCCESDGVQVKDFSNSWADGKAFCCIVHHYHPELIDLKQCLDKDNKYRFETAFATAEKLGVPALLDVTDLLEVKPEPYSTLTYLSLMFSTLEKGNGSCASVNASLTGNNSSPSAPTLHKCAKCGQVLQVDTEAVSACGLFFHPGCFGCFGCGKHLDDEFLTVSGGAYCPTCARKAFITASLDQQFFDQLEAKTESSGSSAAGAAGSSSNAASSPATPSFLDALLSPQSKETNEKKSETVSSEPQTTPAAAGAPGAPATGDLLLSLDSPVSPITSTQSSEGKKPPVVDLLDADLPLKPISTELPSQQTAVKDKSEEAKLEEPKPTEPQKEETKKEDTKAEQPLTQPAASTPTESQQSLPTAPSSSEPSTQDSQPQQESLPTTPAISQSVTSAKPALVTPVFVAPAKPLPKKPPKPSPQTQPAVTAPAVTEPVAAPIVTAPAHIKASGQVVPKSQLSEMEKLLAEAKQRHANRSKSSSRLDSQKSHKERKTNNANTESTSPKLEAPKPEKEQRLSRAPAFEYSKLKRFSVMPGKMVEVKVDVVKPVDDAFPQQPSAAAPAPAVTEAAAAEANPFDTPLTETEAAVVQEEATDSTNPFANPFDVNDGNEEETVDFDPDFDPFAALKTAQSSQVDSTTQDTPIATSADGTNSANTVSDSKQAEEAAPTQKALLKPPPPMEGILLNHEPGLLSLWQPRLFSLQKRHLVWFHDQIRTPESVPTGSIDMFFVETVRLHPSRARTIEIVTIERSYELEAYNEMEAKIWVEALMAAKEWGDQEKARSSEANALHQQSIGQAAAGVGQFVEDRKQGWLNRYGFFHTWKKCWCVARGGVLMHFSNPNSTPTGKIALYRSEMVDRQDLADNSFEIRTISNGKVQSLILSAETEEEMHGWLNSLTKQKLAIEQTIDSLSI